VLFAVVILSALSFTDLLYTKISNLVVKNAWLAAQPHLHTLCRQVASTTENSWVRSHQSKKTHGPEPVIHLDDRAFLKN